MPAIQSVEAHTSWNTISKDWSYLEKTSQASGYQTLAWVRPWFDTLGSRAGLSPLFVLARDESGSPAVLFALAVTEGSGPRIAAYAGARDSNINMPLVRSDAPLAPDSVRRVLIDGGQQAGLDAYALLNQPLEWRGAPHPLSALPHQPSPSFLHTTDLPGAADEVLARLSADTRKRIRWRMRKLQEIGAISLLHARTPEQVRALVETFRRHKRIRIEEMGASAGVDIDAIADFIEAAATSDEPGMHAYGLLVGDRVASMYAGLAHDGCFHAMVNSYDTSPELARSSPGELVTLLLLQRLCEQGFRAFDLGVGEAQYKEKWCERAVPLFDTFLGVTARGSLHCLGQRSVRGAKRFVKQSEWLWPLVVKARALAGRRG